jgi:hypothetical protein
MDETRIIAAILSSGILSKGNLSSMAENAKSAVDTFVEIEKALRAHTAAQASAKS